MPIFVDESSTLVIIAPDFIGIASTVAGKDPKKPIAEDDSIRRKSCPRCKELSLERLEHGKIICLVCGWPDEKQKQKKTKYTV